VINDLFAMIAGCYLDLPPKVIVDDFVRTFYPVVVGEEDPREAKLLAAQTLQNQQIFIGASNQDLHENSSRAALNTTSGVGTSVERA